MYEVNESNIGFKSIIKKVIMVVLGIILIISLSTLITKCVRNDKKENPSTLETEKKDMNKALDEFEAAIMKYLKKDNLPTVLNASKTIRLKILTNNGLIEEIKHEDNICDTSESYAEITKLEKNYTIKISLSCGQSKDYRIIYVGCFKECNGNICKGLETSTNGICDAVTSSNNSNGNNVQSNSNSSTKKPTSGSNTSNSLSSTSTAKPSSSNTTIPSSGNSLSTPRYIYSYEYKRCVSYKTTKCERGDYTATGKCLVSIPHTVYGKVISVSGGTTTKVIGVPTSIPITKVVGTPTPTTITKIVGKVQQAKVYFTDYSHVVNSNSVKYTFIKYNPSKGYEYNKTYCSSGIINGTNCVKTVSGPPKCSIGYVQDNKCVQQVPGPLHCSVGNVQGNQCVVIINNPGSYKCEYSDYTYNVNTNTCYKTTYENILYEPITEQRCETVWSRNPSMEGWHKTGNRQLVQE